MKRMPAVGEPTTSTTAPRAIQDRVSVCGGACRGPQLPLLQYPVVKHDEKTTVGIFSCEAGQPFWARIVLDYALYSPFGDRESYRQVNCPRYYVFCCLSLTLPYAHKDALVPTCPIM